MRTRTRTAHAVYTCERVRVRVRVQYAHPNTTPEISTAARHINEWAKKVRPLAQRTPEAVNVVKRSRRRTPNVHSYSRNAKHCIGQRKVGICGDGWKR